MIGNSSDFFPGNNREISSDIQTLIEPQGELHLRFFLASGDEFALPATGITEVMQQAPEAITPIPNASPLLLGTINLRGQVIWVADLGQFLGDRGILNIDRPEISTIVVEEQEVFLGLAVEKIGEMDWLDFDRLQPPKNIPDSMVSFVQGQWTLGKEAHQYVRLLDQVTILRSARWAT